MTFRTLTAGLLAFSLAFTPLASTPARADGDDVVRALVGIAALLAIADALNDDSGRVHRSYGNTHYPRDRYSGGGKPRHVKKRALPQQCVRAVQNGNRTRVVVVDRCLDRHGYHRKLPNNCKAKVISRHFNSPAYTLRCLRANGYRTARY